MVLGGSIIQDVIVRIKMMTEGVKKSGQEVTQSVQNINKNFSGLTGVMGLSQGAFKSMNMATQLSAVQFKKFAKSIPQKEWNELGFQLSKAGKRVKTETGNWMGFGRAQDILAKRTSEGGGRIANTFRRLTHGMRGFRMEMLGVMFFGMGMQRMFTSLLQPAAQTAGLFEDISTTLEIFFLPAVLKLQEDLEPILEWFQNMPEEQQMVIGQFVILAAAIMMAVFAIGMFALGLGSISLAFGPLMAMVGTGVGWIIAKFAGLFAATKTSEAGFIAFGFSLGKFASFLVGWVAPAIVGILLLWGAWETNRKGITVGLMMLYNAFWKIFGGLAQIVGGVVDFISALIEGDTTKAFDALKTIARGAVDFIVAAFWEWPKAMVTIIHNVLWGIGALIVRIGLTLYDMGQILVQKLIDGLKSMAGKLVEAFWAIIPEPLRSLLKGVAGVIGGIVKGAVGYVGGGAQAVATGIGGFLRAKLDEGTVPFTQAVEENAAVVEDATEAVEDSKRQTEDYTDGLIRAKSATTSFEYKMGDATYSAEDMGIAMDKTGNYTFDLGKAAETTTEMFQGMDAPLKTVTLQTAFLGGTAEQVGDELIFAGNEANNLANAFRTAQSQILGRPSPVGGGGGGGDTFAGKFPYYVIPGISKEIAEKLGVKVGEIIGRADMSIASVATELGRLRSEGVFPAIRYMQQGGLVTRPTMAFLGEAGPEAVIPLGAGGGAFSINPVYNINATISNDMDVRALAERLNDLLTSDYRRLTYR